MSTHSRLWPLRPTPLWRTSSRWLFHSGFAIYIGAVVLWLLLGLIPALADLSPQVDGWLQQLTRTYPGLESYWGKVLFWMRAVAPQSVPLPSLIVQYLFSLLNLGLGMALVRLRPRDLMARLLAVALVGTGAVFNLQSHLVFERYVWDSLGSPIGLLHESLHILAGGSYLIALFLFPTGTVPPLPWHPDWLPARLRTILVALMLFGLSFLGWAYVYTVHWGPEGYVAFFGILVPIVGFISLVLRFRAIRDGQERQILQTWMLSLLLAFGIAIVSASVMALLALPGLPPSWHNSLTLRDVSFTVFPIIFTGIPVSLAFIVLRYRLWELTLVINRSLIYGTLSFSVAALYVLSVAIVGTLLEDRWRWLPSVVSIAVIALLINPLRQRVQSGVNRLMYGDRDDPVGVLVRLGQKLEATAAADETLPAVAETVAHALKLPYVAIDVKEREAFAERATYGTATGPLEIFPLTNHGEVVGRLRVARRSPSEAFHPADRRLLANLAQQAGPVVHVVLLHEALQQSRLRLVTAREEERRRLRRDLHDGLGPQLASLSLKVDAARNSLQADPRRSDKLLGEIKEQITLAIADVRRTVYGLRPPALDQLGLISAIHEHVRRLGDQSDLQIEVVAPDTLPSLAAAVEVAAYHIVLEALTNVMHHAQASRCYVGFCLSDAVHLVIMDDGVGLPLQYLAGVGLTSMRERVDELGGSFAIDTAPGRGTRIEASLPLPALVERK